MNSTYKSAAGREAVHALYRRALRQWPVPHTELVVPMRHGDTFVVASGDTDAPPLVLFHGSGANSSIWLREIAAFSRDNRDYAVDMIGEPGFSAETRPLLSSMRTRRGSTMSGERLASRARASSASRSAGGLPSTMRSAGPTTS